MSPVSRLARLEWLCYLNSELKLKLTGPELTG